MSYKMGSVSFWCHICACKFMHAYIYRDLWSAILDSLRRCRFCCANIVLFPQFDSVWKYLSVFKFVVKILNWHVSMHEQQESVSGEVSIVYVDRHLTLNMTSLKFIRVLEIRGHITKTHLLRTCSVYMYFIF